MRASVDSGTLRRALRRVPSPMTVVTAATERQARGITIGSFASLSLEPPLISFNVTRDAQMHPIITEASGFAVHILHEEQAHLCNHFALPDLTGDEQLSGVAHTVGAGGIPILDDVLTVLYCRRRETFDAGDHTILVGEVQRIDERDAGEPLVYFRRAYHRVGETVESSVVS